MARTAVVTYWRSPRDTFADLPLENNSIGDTRRVLDTFLVYHRDGNSWIVDTSGNPFDYLQLKTDITPVTSQPGLIQWNAVDGTYDMGLLNGSILQVGQETMFYGKASVDILNGDPCQFAGVQGDHILMKKAVASEIEANPHYFIGVATENIANNDYGYITWFGKVNGVYTKTPENNDTQDWIAGDILYMNMSTGYLTKTKPSVPNRNIIVAAVIKEQTGASESGILIVRPSIGIKLEDLDDVNGTVPVQGSIPSYHATEGYFDFDKNINDYLLKESRISLCSQWTAEPVIYNTQPTYEVLEYTYGTTKLYRKIPNTYNPAQDAFYTDDTLTTMVASRALSI